MLIRALKFNIKLSPRFFLSFLEHPRVYVDQMKQVFFASLNIGFPVGVPRSNLMKSLTACWAVSPPTLMSDCVTYPTLVLPLQHAWLPFLLHI